MQTQYTREPDLELIIDVRHQCHALIFRSVNGKSFTPSPVAGYAGGGAIELPENTIDVCDMAF
jgi:hypothetical protein